MDRNNNLSRAAKTKNENDNHPSKTAQKYVQQVVGTLLYYALTIDLTMLVALGSVAAQKNNPTQQTMSEITWLLDYCAENPDAKIRYRASDMVLWVWRDASYLSEPNAKSWVGGLFFLSNKVTSPKKFANAETYHERSNIVPDENNKEYSVKCNGRGGFSGL